MLCGNLCEMIHLFQCGQLIVTVFIFPIKNIWLSTVSLQILLLALVSMLHSSARHRALVQIFCFVDLCKLISSGGWQAPHDYVESRKYRWNASNGPCGRHTDHTSRNGHVLYKMIAAQALVTDASCSSCGMSTRESWAGTDKWNFLQHFR